MRRRTTAERQLVLSWMETLRWEDLPLAQRTQARELLGALLEAAAAHDGGVTGGGGHDGE